MKIAYFQKGMLIAVSPRAAKELYEDRNVAYAADVFVSDGVCYDLHSAVSVASIPVPRMEPTWDILNLAYIMKIRCGVVDDPDLIPVFVSKTLEIMRGPGMMWRRRDYLQVIRNYYRMGLFAQGDQFEAEYRSQFSQDFSDTADEKHELEHESTKRYFKQKWEKKHK